MIQYSGAGLVPGRAPVPLQLGKPTMRGIRKCPKCGTYNGTRGLSCKNKQCDMVFKEAEGRTRRAGCDAVRLYTGDNTSIFSVRLREKAVLASKVIILKNCISFNIHWNNCKFRIDLPIPHWSSMLK